MPAALALLSATFTDVRAGTRALAVWTAAAAGGGAAGFLIGGLVTGAAGWRWVFLLNVPIALLAAAFASHLLDESRGGQRRARPLKALRGAAGPAAIACVLTATTGGSAVLVTSHVQDVLGASPATTGLIFLPFSVLVAAGSLAGPQLVARLGRNATIASGLALVAVGMLVFATASAAGASSAIPGVQLGGTLPLLAGLAISGAGLGWSRSPPPRPAWPQPRATSRAWSPASSTPPPSSALRPAPQRLARSLRP